MVVGLTKLSLSDSAGSSIGEAARLQDAALHVLDALLEVHVAGIERRTRC